MIVDNITRLCKERKITIAQLEREAGIGNGVIARWAVGNPSLGNLQKVAAYFGCSLESLLKEAAGHQD